MFYGGVWGGEPSAKRERRQMEIDPNEIKIDWLKEIYERVKTKIETKQPETESSNIDDDKIDKIIQFFNDRSEISLSDLNLKVLIPKNLNDKVAVKVSDVDVMNSVAYSEFGNYEILSSAYIDAKSKTIVIKNILVPNFKNFNLPFDKISRKDARKLISSKTMEIKIMFYDPDVWSKK